MPQRIAIAVVQHEDQFLVGRRPPGVPLAGLWEFPGGKVGEEESPAAAAIRECREETGLEVQVQGAYPVVLHPYSHGLLELYFFHCTPKFTAEVQNSTFAWKPRAELAELEFPAANRALVQAIVSRSANYNAV